MQATNREIWKSVDGYANYEVSCFGRVRNATTERILKPGLSSSGYLNVMLYKNSKGKSFNVHQLVAKEFLENPLNKPSIDHIDNNKTNNNFDNLRFCNQSQNGGNRKKNKKPPAQVLKVFAGVREITNGWRI